MNEQAESEEIYRHLEQCRIERDSAKADRAALMKDCETYRKAYNHVNSVLNAVKAERDALAVTAERYRLALLRLANRAWGTPEEDPVHEIVANALLVTAEEVEGMS